MASFNYQPLNHARNEIRLIRLVQATELGLECTLEHTSLDSSSPYECLSYTWGSLKYNEEIILNSHPFPVTSNLYHALNTIFRSTQTRILWVDAICINQLDIEERSLQVLRMPEIYGGAFHVIIWLGPKSFDSDLAISLISKRRRTGYEAAFPRRTLRRLKADPSAWKAIENFFARSWWRRVWIVQEYILARKATFFCGEAMITRGRLEGGLWDPSFSTNEDVEARYASYASPLRNMRNHRFSMGMDTDLDEQTLEEEDDGEQSTSSDIEDSGTDDGRSVGNDSLSGDKPGTSKYPRQPASTSQSDPDNYDLVSLLVWYSDYQATDARDRIYAFIRLANSTPGDIRPDYNKTANEVFLDLVKAVIKQTSSLNCLYNTHWATKSDDWFEARPASWPVWARNFFGRSHFHFYMGSDPLARTYGHPINIAKLNQDPQALVLEGVIMDTISWLSGPKPAVDYAAAGLPKFGPVTDCPWEEHLCLLATWEYGDPLTHLLRKWEPPELLQPNARYPNGQTLPHAYMCALTLDPNFNYKSIYPQGMEKFQEPDREYLVWSGRDPEISMQRFRRDLAMARKAEEDRKPSYLRLEGEMIWHVMVQLWEGGKCEVHEWIEPRSRGMQFGTTEEGYMGWLPPKAKQGDQICFLSGADTPVVIRPARKEGRWQMIGSCNLHMGDMTSRQVDSGKSMQDIIIGVADMSQGFTSH